MTDNRSSLRIRQAYTRKNYLADIRFLYECGQSSGDLAKLFEVSQNVMFKHLQEAGTKMRTSQEGQKLAFKQRKERKGIQ